MTVGVERYGEENILWRLYWNFDFRPFRIERQVRGNRGGKIKLVGAGGVFIPAAEREPVLGEGGGPCRRKTLFDCLRVGGDAVTVGIERYGEENILWRFDGEFVLFPFRIQRKAFRYLVRKRVFFRTVRVRKPAVEYKVLFFWVLRLFRRAAAYYFLRRDFTAAQTVESYRALSFLSYITARRGEHGRRAQAYYS